MDGLLLRIIILGIIVLVAWILGAGKDNEK